MKRSGLTIRTALLFSLVLGLVAWPPSARTEDEPLPPTAEEQESGEETEPEEAAPPPDFRPTEEIPFDMGIDFPVDI